MERLKDKVAIVTGGAGGIGTALAHGLAEEGASVVIADLDGSAAEKLAAHMIEDGYAALALQVDVSDHAASHGMAGQTLDRFGRIDILVNNAAIYADLPRKPFMEIEPSEWNAVLAVNLTGAQLCARAVIPAMEKQGGGVIVNMVSVNSFLAPAGRAHYNAGKAALENLTKTLARELGPLGIRVNALSPGLVKTGTARHVTDERYEETAHTRALHRDLLPQDLVGPLVFLCSDDAHMVTGHSLVVDGGQIFR